MKLNIQIIVYLICLLSGCQEYPVENKCKKLETLDILKSEPKEGDWLYENKVANISLQDYIKTKPPQTDSLRKYIYVVKLGEFKTQSDSIFQITKEFLSAFFLIQVKQLSDLDVASIPPLYIRENGQLNAAYIIDSMLVKILPDDAHSVIALSSIDLYPGNDWNYVFGLASLQNRVGIWSIARFVESNGNEVDFKISLLRTLHTASHETGHMFGIKHCSMYECNMNGANSLSELDAQVSWLCNNCMSKLCWNRNIEPSQHIESMYSFYKKYFIDSANTNYYRDASALMKE